MEFMIVIVLGFIFFLIVGSVMGFVANARTRNLERQIQLLRRDLLENSRLPRDPESARTAANIKPEPGSKPKPEPEPKTTGKSVQIPGTAMAAASAPAPIQTTAPKPKPAQAKRKSRKAARPVKKNTNFEFELGAKWTVWVGGLALLLGAVFLLRYSIEAGFFTPAMRVGMAAIMGAGLLGAGEWLRRGDKLPKGANGQTLELFENNYIPGILTAVGIFTLLGTVFAAYELYGFIGSNMAFILMGLISIAALALGLIHGPWVSAIGLVAAFATPILIKSDDPSFSGLYIYLFVISAAAWILSRLRDWGWLLIGSCLGGLFWLFYTIEHAHSGQNFYIWMAYLISILAVNFYLAKDRKLLPANPNRTFINHNGRSAFILSALLAFAYFWLSVDAEPVESQKTFVAIGLTGALALFPLIKRFSVAHLWIAGLLAFFFQSTHEYGSFALSMIFAGILGLAGFAYCFRSKPQEENAGKLETVSLYAAVLIPPMIVASSLEYGKEVSDTIIGVSILGMSALFGFIAVVFKNKSHTSSWVSAYLWGAALAYLIAVLILFDKPYLNGALAAGIAIFALVYKFIDIAPARWISLVFGLITLGTTLFFSIGDYDALSARAIFNEIWIYLALPAALCFWAGRELRRKNEDLASESLLALSITFAALFFIYQIRHYIHDSYVHKLDLTFEELGLYVATGLAFTLGRRFIKIPVLASEKQVGIKFVGVILSALTWVTLGIFLLLICLAFAPLFNPEIDVKGGQFLNSLTLAYLLPCSLMGLIIWMSRRQETNLQTNAMRLLSLGGIMLFITSQIRVLFSGSRISLFHKFPEGLETYVITASWLLIGVIALAIGIKYKRKAFRVGSAVVIFLTVVKAFLVDMATLEGVLRAISFVILGVVLIIIGRVYQKLLFEQETDPA